MNKTRWLSTGAEVLVEELNRDNGADFDCDVLIVGSGYGGAVAAARLAGAKTQDGREIKVYVLERGQEHLPGTFPQTFAELPGHVRFSMQDGRPARGVAEGLFDVRIGSDVNALLGNGLGGGSLINAAVMERPQKWVFHKARWPDGIRGKHQSLDEHYDKASAMLGPESVVADSARYGGDGNPPKYRALKVMAGSQLPDVRLAKLAINFSSSIGAPGKCIGCGDCVTGCNHNAKKSLDANYLALAYERGARLFCGATVQQVKRINEGQWEVAFFLTRNGGRDTQGVVHRLRTRCLILAAGTFGSTEILLRSSKASGSDLSFSQTLGTRFSANGDAISVAIRQTTPFGIPNSAERVNASAQESIAPRDRGIGPTITGLVTTGLEDQPESVVIEEFAIPAALRRVFAEVVTTFGAIHEMTIPDVTTHHPNEDIPDPLAADDVALSNTSIYGLMGDDGSEGVVTLQGGRDVLADGLTRIMWDGVGNQEVFESQQKFLRTQHQVGPGGRIIPNPLWQPLPKELSLTKKGSVSTVHPLGGCPMGNDVASGVVDHAGRVFESGATTYKGLVVLDGSIVPEALGINPALTIAALAERAIPLLANDWGLTLASAAAPTLVRPTRLRGVRPASPTEITIDEELTGEVTIDGKLYEAVLKINVGAIKDLAKFVRRLPRTAPIVKASLTIRTKGTAPQSVDLQGEARILTRGDKVGKQDTSSANDRAGRAPGDQIKKEFTRVGSMIGGKAPGFLTQARIYDAVKTRLGSVRTLTYSLSPVSGAALAAPLQGLESITFRKTLDANSNSSPWRQLSEGSLTIQRSGKSVDVGRLALDLDALVRNRKVLVDVLQRSDQPNMLGDLAELGLFTLRVVLNTALLHFLPPNDQPTKASERSSGVLNGITPIVSDHGAPGASPHKFRLSRYKPTAPAKDSNAIVLIHGFGAAGSTFSHPSIGTPLADFLLGQNRDVWVLDLRTSIALEQRVTWTFEEVAEDIPAAIDEILKVRTKDGLPAEKVDVVAHCIGAAMFSIAALNGSICHNNRELHQCVGAAVLSQVGPLIRMSPWNRLRGYLMSYLKQFLGVETLDVSPPTQVGMRHLLLDGLLNTFPYPDHDNESKRLATAGAPRFAAMRHRADAIFGQLMELGNVSDATLGALDAIYGWVRTETLAQTVHYARNELVSDAEGMNRLITRQNLGERFNFPILMIHGRRNAVFDWRGSYDTFRLLESVFADDTKLPAEPEDSLTNWGEGRRVLKTYSTYGHQDCLIGQNASADIFPDVFKFLENSKSLGPPPATSAPKFKAELPWIGPLLGWTRVVRAPDSEKGALTCRLNICPSPSQAPTPKATATTLFVPVQVKGDGNLKLDLDAGVARVGAPTSPDMHEITYWPDAAKKYLGFVVTTVSDDITKDGHGIFGPGGGLSGDDLPETPFVRPSSRLTKGHKTLVKARFGDSDEFMPSPDIPLVRFAPSWMKAADQSQPDENLIGPNEPLTFALGSCQYPASLVDRIPAQKSLARLAGRLESDSNPPQFLLLTGDQVYADEVAGLFAPMGRDTHARAYEINFRLPAFRAVTNRLPTYFMLDDHEIVDNWEPGRPLPDVQYKHAIDQYMRRQQCTNPDGYIKDYFGYCLYPAGLPFFALDTRSRRSGRSLDGKGLPKFDAATIIPDNAMAELQAWLQRMPAGMPKFVISPAPVFPFDAAGWDCDAAERVRLDDWCGYPKSLRDLLGHIAEKSIQNVIFLSGDPHLSMVSSLTLTNAAGQATAMHSVVSSGLNSPWPFANGSPADFVLNQERPHSFLDSINVQSVKTPIFSTADAFAIVTVGKRNGRWQVAVTLDTADGKLQCELLN